MSNSRNRVPRDLYPLDSLRNSILDILIQVYVDETAQFVANGLTAEIKATLARSNLSNSTRDFLQERLKWVQLWRNSDTPFASATDSLVLLVRCFLTSPSDNRSSLPSGSVTFYTRRDFALALYKKATVGQRPREATAKLPIIKGGSFYRVFEVFLTFSLFPSLDTNDPSSISETSDKFVPLFEKALDRASISVIPTFDSSGGPHVSYKAFVVLSASPSTNSRPLPPSIPVARMSQPQRQQAHVESAVRRIQAADTNAAWTYTRFNHDFSFLLTAASAPTDIDPRSLKYSGMNSTEADFFDWVHSSWNLNFFLHRLALILGIAIAEAMPELAIPEESTRNPPVKGSDVKDWLRRLPWGPVKKSKGVTERIPYVTLIVCWLVAAYDPTSPIYSRTTPAGTRSYDGFGDTLTKKFSNKSIKPSLFAHVGVIKPTSASILKKPLMNKNWELLTMEELEGFWSCVHHELLHGRYSGHRLFRLLFGDALAGTMADRLNLPRADEE
ncbi:hypothetical protein BC834DRAFT_1043992 [Gloeopeniophorella convolvens]|nr:hypothetical protein BC834DRAFT_1043992 [Gloeopeniophorella convolvens]